MHATPRDEPDVKNRRKAQKGDRRWGQAEKVNERSAGRNMGTGRQ